MSKLPDSSVLKRWKGVHQTFWVIVQGLVILIAQLKHNHDTNLSQSDRDRLIEELETLLDGAAMALRLAGDMSAQQYETIVRPDMIAHNERMTGLWSPDHQHMLQALKSLRDVLRPEETARLAAAIERCYEAHASVCEMCVGEHETSLVNDRAPAGETLRTRYGPRTIAYITPPETVEPLK